MNPKLPTDLQTIVAKAMDPEPDRRYQTADELADDLERLLSLHPIRARPAGLVTRTVKLARRNKRAVAGAAVGGSLVLILSILAGIYLILVPGWVEAHVRNARLTLLDPLQSDRVLGMLYGFARPDAPAFPAADSAHEALAACDAALFWRPFDDDLGIERDIVRLAHDLSEDSMTQPFISGALEHAAPLACKYARTWTDSSRDGPPEIAAQELNIADPTDLRALGLLAFLCSDPHMCVAAWEKLDLIRHPDPFVEATLGQLYLMTDRAPEALGHLTIALQEYPSAGFLHVDLADALVQIGSLDKAGKRIDEAREMGGEDPNFGLKRVEADYFAARGRDAEAREIYEWFRRKRQNPPARRSYGHFLESRGELREAVQVYQELVKLRPSVAKFHVVLLAAADAWWASLPPTERYSILRRSLDTHPRNPRSFPAMLLSYGESLAALKRLNGASERCTTAGVDESEPTRGDFRQATVTLGPAYFSTFIQKVTLMELGHRMEVSDMDRWAQMSTYSRFLKDAQASAWLLRRPGFCSKLVGVLHTIATSVRRARDSVIAATVAATTLGAPVAQGDWISIDNGPANDRRAAGQALAGQWREVWRLPYYGSPSVLVRDGRVVFRDNPNNRASYRAVWLSDGTSLWEGYIATDARTHTTGCIIADRVFLSLSNGGTGNPNDNFTEMVECVDLATGTHLWTWNSQRVGMVRELQPVAWNPLFPGGPAADRVVFNVSERAGTAQAQVWKTRLVVLNAESNVPEVLVETGPFAGNTIPAYREPAVYARSLGGPGAKVNVFYQHALFNAPGSNWASFVLRVHDLFSGEEPTEPFLPSSPALSGVTVSPFPVSTTQSPPVIDVNRSRGYLFETGGWLRAYDLDNGIETWNRQITGSNINMIPLLQPNSGHVVMVDRVDGTITAYAGATGDPVWLKPTLAPGIPHWDDGVVLDDDVILLPFENGDIYGVDAGGTLLGPVHTEPNVRRVTPVGGRFLVATNSELICYAPAARGDLNCDGRINALDIGPFLVALVDPGRYANQYPNCDISLADMNGDGEENGLDIAPFVDAVLAP